MCMIAICILSVLLVSVAGQVSPQCQCVGARLDYWARYTVVAAADYDAAFHMQAWGPGLGFTWNCDWCSAPYTPVYQGDSVCQCAAAKARYVATAGPGAAADPYGYYLSTVGIANAIPWHCELCTGGVGTDLIALPTTVLDWDCTCIAARHDYWARYTDVYNAPLDPVFHYVQYGYSGGRTWNCALCNTYPMYINESFFRCDAAETNYLTTYTYDASPFADHFVQFAFSYLLSGRAYKSNLCPIPTTCVPSLFDYWARYQDVLAADMDPLYHFNNYGKHEGRRWNVDVCTWNTMYVQDACNCSAAQIRYKTSHPSVVGDPMTHYLTANLGYAWHCELCSLPIASLPDSYGCLAAMADYVYRYPETKSFDPIYHYKWFGYSKGYTWNSSLCNVNPHYPTDSVCNCSEAANAFIYATYQQVTDPRTHFINTRVFGAAWHCEYCVTSVADPSTSLTCNCTSARALYLSTYAYVSIDPWVHYTTTGKSSGLTWDCGICNDTCPGKYGPNVLVNANQQSGTFNTGEDVIVPAGCYVGITNLTVQAANFYVNGTLRCSSDNGVVNILAKKVWVYGALECGAAAAPFKGKYNITLYGDKPAGGTEQGDRVGGDKSVAVFNEGKLSFHGNKQLSWTRLSQTAFAGTTQINVFTVGDWQVGDRLVIATTANYNSEDETTALNSNEIVTITSISGNTINFSPALVYTHLSAVYNLTSSLTLIKQAEVGLLSTRNIVVQGDYTSVGSQFGAHVIILPGGRAYASGLQLTQVGQVSILARYPFHWHLLGDIPSGQYIKNSTVSYSYNRCITVHGTNNTVVANNTCFNFIGHGYFLENGVEVGNVIDSNLGILAIRPLVQNAIIPSDYQQGPHAFGPSVFWISNPSNTFTNNVGVASPGSAFWFQLESTPGGQFAAWTSYNPQQKVWGTVNNNQGHSVQEGFNPCPADGGIGGTTYAGTKIVNKMVVWGAGLGIWPCGTAPTNYTNIIIAETQLGMQVPTPQYINNIAFVDYLNISNRISSSNAINIYDSGWTISNAFFKNYDTPSNSIFRTTESAGFDTRTAIKTVTKVNSPYITIRFIYVNNITYTGLHSEWSHFVNDLDGTLTGSVGALVSSHPLMRSPLCHIQNIGYLGYVCPHTYGDVTIVYYGTNLLPATIKRYNRSSGLDDAIPATNSPFPSTTFYRWAAIVNTNQVYVFVMPVGGSSNLQYISMQPYSNHNDHLMLEIHNVAKITGSVSGATLRSNCNNVYSATTQSYYFDSVHWKICLKLYATAQYGASWAAPQFFANATAYTDISEQPPPPSFGYTIPYAQTCLNARAQYWYDNADVLALKIDPVYHYQSTGYSDPGRTWRGDLCTGDALDYYIEDHSLCTCGAAEERYEAEVNVGPYYSDGYSHYLAYRWTYGYAYHCEQCMEDPPTNPNQHIEDSCRCMAARLSYWSYNTDVYNVNMDPVFHFETYGYSSGRTWPDCSVCSSSPVYISDSVCRCNNAASNYVSTYPDAAAYDDPFDHYWNNYMIYGNSWHAELCPGV